jgi:hypothetical protein
MLGGNTVSQRRPRTASLSAQHHRTQTPCSTVQGAGLGSARYLSRLLPHSCIHYCSSVQSAAISYGRSSSRTGRCSSSCSDRVARVGIQLATQPLVTCAPGLELVSGRSNAVAAAPSRTHMPLASFRSSGTCSIQPAAGPRHFHACILLQISSQLM